MCGRTLQSSEQNFWKFAVVYGEIKTLESKCNKTFKLTVEKGWVCLQSCAEHVQHSSADISCIVICNCGRYLCWHPKQVNLHHPFIVPISYLAMVKCAETSND